MQAVTAFAPLAAFFLAYALRGLYAATAVLMVAMVVLVAFEWLWQRRIAPLHALSALLVLLLGSATLLLHNRLFIQWKPTVLFWVVSIAFLGSGWIGGRTLTERFLGPALEGRLQASADQWRLLNGWSAAFYALLGGLNLAVAYSASERAWVYFKMFGLALIIFVFVALQVVWLSSRAAPLAAEQPAAPGPP
jgi:intracellular septation protein